MKYSDGSDISITPNALREISILKKLNHPNIVKLLDFFLHIGSVHLIFEYCDYDLRTYLDS